MKYAAEQRLSLSHFLLAHYGHVNRCAIIDYFAIGQATATRDFSEYKKLQPANMTYNANDRTYYKTKNFKRIWP